MKSKLAQTQGGQQRSKGYVVRRTQRESTTSMRAKCLESMMIERLQEPEEVKLFEEFEELRKLYTIEPAYTSRTQIELMFDVYDGRKLQQGGLMDEDEREQETYETSGVRASKPSFEQLTTGARLSRTSHLRLRKAGVRNNFSWCKFLLNHNNRMQVKCCLKKSETNEEFCLSQSSLSGGLSNGITPIASNDAISTAFLPEFNDDQEDAELKAEAMQMIGPLLSQLRRSSTLSEASKLDQSVQNGLEQQQVILDASLDSGNISVCLFDKRTRLIKIKLEAENGRRWAQVESRLRELRWRVRCCSISKSKELEAMIERFISKQIDARVKPTKCAFSEKLSKDQLEQLVESTKNSLNQLIDAQLLLRNKLNSEQEQQPARGNDYEILLKNNFNLLKIWQNLEETKRLVCFVCEPIKTNLCDLFWFSRHRPEVQVESSTTTTLSEYILASPLVCLDAIQVKRGLLQILEALNYLHSICKLIHRNVNPRNILVASNDNWKLSGLEFAIRFESATISESASIMAHEGSSLLRYSSGAGAQAALRRQKTLHQTKCDEFVKRPKSGILQPDINYLAPEIWRTAKCSHKSDMFSFGLVLGQTYDLCRHRSPISCKASVQNYDTELKKLNDRRKRKLSRLVPFEMRAAFLELLECEPNLRPSANYALQLFRRPIELCKVNEDSLRHLKSSLGYLDTHWLNNNASRNINSSISNNAAHKKRITYFRKVTLAANQSPRRRQTRNLHLLNLLLRGVDSLAAINNGNMVTDFGRESQQQQQQQQQQNFFNLRQQFEHTFESLRQLYNSTKTSDSFTCPDSRSIMLIVAFHRRLLDQVAQMRAELPPVYRLTAANMANRPTQNHRVLAELEDKLHCLVSRQSMAKLAPVLTDPLLKIDEFLLVYELINDLLSFIGQKCRQDFVQRGRQLLTELTPVTGCPSLSSSDEEDSGHIDICATPLGGSNALIGACDGGRHSVSSRETLNNISNNSSSVNKKMNNHRFSEYDDQQSSKKTSQLRHLQQTNLPTKISITAPSPMGSMREVNRASMDSHTIESQLIFRCQQQQQEEQIIEGISDLSLNSVECGENEREVDDDGDLQQEDSDQSFGKKRDKSRSQLIDELLRTINDDSFNEIVDFNNKFAAQTGGSSQQLSAAQLANSNRPRSAIDCSQTNSFQSSERQQQLLQQSSNRPILAYGSNQQQQQQTRSGAPPSTFDNVIRRMSTNFVQNFNKMSASTLATSDQQDSSNLRREKSSNCANSLYVDSQVPTRRHSDNTINIPRIQVALSSPQSHSSRSCLNQRASTSASKLANKWKLSAKTNKQETSDKLSPNLSGALGYIRRHSSGNPTGNDQSQSNGQTSNLLLNTSPFKTKSSSNLGLDFLMSNRSMKRRCSAASMLGHQTQRKAENLIDAGMKGVQNMFK